MSGMSSEGIAPTDGRYGFVALCGVSSPPTSQPRIEPYLLQVHFVARVAALLTVILNMIGFDTTSPINCQVSLVSHV
jgi:hypothetical protein